MEKKLRKKHKDAVSVASSTSGEGRILAVCGANRPDHRDLSLDVVRGFAIFLAMGYHINQTDSGPFLNFFLRPGAKIGWAGVDLFFVLSGFLIGRMILSEVNLTGRLNYRRFLIRRIFRLWPTLYIFLFAMLLFGYRADDFFWQIALHIQGYARTKSATHLWSLAVEEQFYLILGLGFPLISQYFSWKRSFPRILIAIMIGCPLMRAMGSWLGVSYLDLYVLTHFRIDALACGVLLAYLASERSEMFEYLLSRRKTSAMLAALGILFLWNVQKDSLLGAVVGYSISYLTSAAFLMFLYKMKLTRFFRWPYQILIFLGNISYPLYLWHVAVFKIGQKYLPRITGEESGALQTLLIYIASVAVAFAVTTLVERPAMQLRDLLFPRTGKALISP